MKIKLDHIIPFALVAGLVCLFIFNNKTPTTTQNGNTVIQPKHEFQFFRSTDAKDSVENDHSAIIKHIPSGDEVKILIKDDQIVLPNGETKLPTKKDEAGVEKAIWDIKPTQKDIFFDLGWDFGTYAGILDNVPKNQNKTKDYDVGLKFSPIKIYNTAAIDFLVSGQDAGIGISVYPLPLRYGDIWHHVGVGYGRVIDYDVKEQHNMFYLSFSTRF